LFSRPIWTFLCTSKVFHNLRFPSTPPFPLFGRALPVRPPVYRLECTCLMFSRSFLPGHPQIGNTWATLFFSRSWCVVSPDFSSRLLPPPVYDPTTCLIDVSSDENFLDDRLLRNRLNTGDGVVSPPLGLLEIFNIAVPLEMLYLM